MTDYTSQQSGSWNNSATWGGIGVPALGDKATIQSGHTVTIDSDAAVGTDTLPVPTNDDDAKYDLRIKGSLKWDTTPAADYTFTIDGHTLIDSGAVFEIGSEASPIPDDRKATVYFPLGIAIRYIVLAETTSMLRVYGSETAHRADAASQRTTVKTAFTMGTNVIVAFNDDVDYEAGDVVLLAMGGDKLKKMGGVNAGTQPFPTLYTGISSGSDVAFRLSAAYEYFLPGDKIYFDDGASSEIVTIKTKVDDDDYTADFAYAHSAGVHIYYYGEEKVEILTKVNASTYTVNAYRNHMAGDMAIHWERNVVFEGETDGSANHAGPLVTAFGHMFKLDINWAAFITPPTNALYAPNYQYMAAGDWKVKNVLVEYDDFTGYFMRLAYSGETNVNEVGIEEIHMFRSMCIYCYNNVGNLSLGHLSGIKCTRPVLNTGTGGPASIMLDIAGVWYTGDSTGSYTRAIYQEGNGRLGYVKIHYSRTRGMYIRGNEDRGFMRFRVEGGEVHNCLSGVYVVTANVDTEVTDVQFAHIVDAAIDLGASYLNNMLVRGCSFDACNWGDDSSVGALRLGTPTSMQSGERLYNIRECDFGMTLQNYRANIFTGGAELYTGSRIIVDKCRFKKPISSLNNAGMENELSWVLGSSAFSNTDPRMRLSEGCTLEMIEPEVYAVADADSYWKFGGGTYKANLTLEGDVAQDFDPAQNTGSFTVIGHVSPDSVAKTGGLMSKWNVGDDKRCWKLYFANSDMKFAVSKSGLAGGDATEVSQGGMTATPHFFCARYTYVADGTSVMKLEVAGVETVVSNAVGPVFSSELADVKVADNVGDETDYYDGAFIWLAYVNRALSDSEKDDIFSGSIKLTDVDPDSAFDFGRGVYDNSRYPTDIGGHWFRVGLYNQKPTSIGTLGSRFDIDIWAKNKAVGHFTVSGGGGTVEDETVEVIDNTFAVKMHPFTEVVRNSGTGGQPLLLPVNAGQTITVKLSIKKNKAVAVGKRPAIFLQGLGIIDEAEASATIDAWEELTVTGTAVVQGMVKFWVSQGANEYSAAGAPSATLFPKSLNNITVYADKLVITRS